MKQNAGIGKQMKSTKGNRKLKYNVKNEGRRESSMVYGACHLHSLYVLTAGEPPLYGATAGISFPALLTSQFLSRFPEFSSRPLWRFSRRFRYWGVHSGHQRLAANKIKIIEAGSWQSLSVERWYAIFGAASANRPAFICLNFGRNKGNSITYYANKRLIK